MKSVQGYGLKLLGESYGNLKKGNLISHTKTSILIGYCTVPSTFPFLGVSVFTEMHWHFPAHDRIPNSTEHQIRQACKFDRLNDCSMSQHATYPSLLKQLHLNSREIMKIITVLVISTVMLFNDASATEEVVSHRNIYVHLCKCWVVTRMKGCKPECSDSIQMFL